MKKAIWISFVTLALLWTTFAFLAAGLARWTADAIASDLWAETTMYVAQTSERVTQRVTDASVRAAEEVATKVTRAVGDATVNAEQLPVEGPAAPVLPPLPEWANQWLAPETVRSIEEWGVWANSAANAGKAVVADAANKTARAVPEVLNKSQSTARAADLDVEASRPVEATNLQAVEIQNETDAPWLAEVVGWLVPIVWIVWGIGLILGLLLALAALWGVNRLIGSSPLNPISPG